MRNEVTGPEPRPSRSPSAPCPAGWEGAIEQVASRKFFVKSCDFLQVASFHFSGRRTSFWPGRRQKKNHPGWFECDAARSIASIKCEFDFWTILSHYDDAKNVPSFAQKLLTCHSSIRNVERCHKLIARHRTQFINREIASQQKHVVKLQLQRATIKEGSKVLEKKCKS